MTTLKIGLTGGIGSGKTTVANLFKDLEIPVYIADVEAKKLMLTSKVLIRQLKQLFGDAVYINKALNKDLIRSEIFSDKDLLIRMNAIVHPKVARHFNKWFKKQTVSYVISESALIFENGNQSNYDAIITVTAPKEVRINRVVLRDDITSEHVNRIINNQLNDDFKVENSQFVITNVDLEETKRQVLNCHNEILKTLDKN